jgi:hypothetical protein
MTRRRTSRRLSRHDRSPYSISSTARYLHNQPPSHPTPHLGHRRGLPPLSLHNATSAATPHGRTPGPTRPSQKTSKIQEKTCTDRLDVPRKGWLMCHTPAGCTPRRTPRHEATTMEADQIFFGVEFESTLSAHDDTPIGPYHHGIQVPWLPAGWKAERDGSIRALVPGRKGCEFVSPQTQGRRGAAGGRGGDRRHQRPGRSSKSELWAPFVCAIRWRRLGPREAHLPGRKPREGHLREHRNAAPGAGHLFKEDQGIRQQGPRERKVRGGPVPHFESHAPRPRSEPNRVQGLRRDTRPHILIQNSSIQFRLRKRSRSSIRGTRCSDSVLLSSQFPVEWQVPPTSVYGFAMTLRYGFLSVRQTFRSW